MMHQRTIIIHAARRRGKCGAENDPQERTKMSHALHRRCSIYYVFNITLSFSMLLLLYEYVCHATVYIVKHE